MQVLLASKNGINCKFLTSKAAGFAIKKNQAGFVTAFLSYFLGTQKSYVNTQSKRALYNWDKILE